MHRYMKSTAALVAISLLVGCPKTPTATPKTGSGSPAAKLVSQLAAVRASALAVHNAAKGVAPTLSLSASTKARRVMSVSDSSASAGVETESDVLNQDGSVDAQETGPDGQVDEQIHADKPVDQVDADGNHDVSDTFDVSRDLGGHPGKYAVREKKDRNGNVLSGEVDYTDADQQAEKTTFVADSATGNDRVHVDQADGSRGDFEESTDAQGDVEASGSVKLADGSAANLDIKLNKNGTAALSASSSDASVTITIQPDGGATGEVRGPQGNKLGDLSFDRHGNGAIAMADGSKVAISFK